MAFTGVLGLDASQLGSFQLAHTASIYDLEASNTLVFTQLASDEADVSSLLNLDHEVICAAVFARNASSTFTISQLAEVIKVVLLTANNTLVFSQTAVGQRILIAANTITFTQSALSIEVRDEPTSSTLTFSQSATGFVPNQRPSSTLTLTSTVNLDTVLERSSSHTLTFSQLSEAVQVRPASNTITFTGEADVAIGKGAENTFTLSQSLAVNLTPHNDTATNTLTFVGVGASDAVFNRSLSQTLTVAQSATSQIVKEASASNIFVMASQSQGFKVLRASNTIVFTNTTVANKVVSLSVTSTLNFQQTLTRTATYNLTLTSQLVFPAIYQKPTMLGGVYSYTPIPQVILTKVINRVSFRTKDRAIILRPPLLGDGEAGTGKIVLQRTITGGTYVYARRTSTRKLKYTFETDSFKAFEMRRFMLDCLSEPIWLENWKGEIWVGYFMSNPFAMTTRNLAAPCGEWHSFDIEFEGERIH